MNFKRNLLSNLNHKKNKYSMISMNHHLSLTKHQSTKLITSRTRSQSPVKTTSSSSNENNVQKTSKLNRRRDNDAPNTSKSNSAFRKKGRPPGIGKVIAGRILKKYRCPHCHLTYIHLPSFNNHQQVCKSMKATALQLSNNKRLMKS